MPQNTIESVSRESRVFAPPDDFARTARIGSLADYEAMYRRSMQEPELFWAEQLRELFWFQEPKRSLRWEPPHAKWFEDGLTNLAFNCLDRHLDGARVVGELGHPHPALLAQVDEARRVVGPAQLVVVTLGGIRARVRQRDDRRAPVLVRVHVERQRGLRADTLPVPRRDEARVRLVRQHAADGAVAVVPLRAESPADGGLHDHLGEPGRRLLRIGDGLPHALRRTLDASRDLDVGGRSLWCGGGW